MQWDFELISVNYVTLFAVYWSTNLQNQCLTDIKNFLKKQQDFATAVRIQRAIELQKKKTKQWKFFKPLLILFLSVPKTINYVGKNIFQWILKSRGKNNVNLEILP